jgi:hypothetical protein
MLEPSKSQSSSNLLSVLGWVFGAMSVLNLVNDIGRVAVFGKLKTWLDAYVTFVSLMGNFFFGWIKLGWISVSPEEYHVLIVMGIFCAAYFRAEYPLTRSQGNTKVDAFFTALTISLIYFLFALVPVLLFGGIWGVAAGIVGIIFFTVITLPNHGPGATYANGAAVRRELYGVLGVFLVLLAVNYSLLRADGG